MYGSWLNCDSICFAGFAISRHSLDFKNHCLFEGTTFGIRSIWEINSVTRHDLFGTPILTTVTYSIHLLRNKDRLPLNSQLGATRFVVIYHVISSACSWNNCY